MLEVRLSGTFDIRYDGKPVTISSRAAQSLFAYLIITAGTFHRREKLAGIFWPDATEASARAYLRHELWRIRKALSPQSKVDYLFADDINISFNSSADYWLDVTSLENVSETGSMEELMVALSTYQGELLPGFYDEWIVLEREHLQAVYENKMARLLDLLEKAKCWQDILEWAERWISLGQEPEAAYRALMVAYDALGDRAKVASTYLRCVKALRELDLEPTEQTHALAFKRTSKLNIPVSLTSFIGREKELNEIADLISKSRLVTLIGSGGVGKTRLSIQVVANLLKMFPDGVWFFDLAPLTDPALVPSTLAGLLGLRETAESKLSITDLIKGYLCSRTALIIFDNCEHLVESSARLVDSLLRSCDGLHVLATSREALRVSGETPYRVPSLEIPRLDIEPAMDILAKMESVRLFVERASTISPGIPLETQNFLVIARICQRLDGIPLAIELAAARANMLTFEQILKRLDDRFNLLTGGLRTALSRHQTLHATIAWSYDLLSEQERLLFRRLAVFMGGWNVEAAEDVCSGSGIESSDVLDLLSQLVNKSLVIVDSAVGETRYRRLETIRQYAHEKLLETEEVPRTRDRHLNFFVDWVENLAEYRNTEPKIWMDKMALEHNNLHMALEWALGARVDSGIRLIHCMIDYWFNIGYWYEGLKWCRSFLASPESLAQTPDLVRAFARSGLLALTNLEQAEAQSWLQAGLILGQEINDQAGVALVYRAMARIFSLSSRESQEYLGRALEIARRIGDQPRIADVLSALGDVELDEGNLALARAYYEESLMIARERRLALTMQMPLAGLGNLAYLEGELDSARMFFERILTLFREENNKNAQAWILSRLADVVLRQGDHVMARSHLKEAKEISQELGESEWMHTYAPIEAIYLIWVTHEHKRAVQICQERYQWAKKIGYRVNMSLVLEALAEWAVSTGQAELGIRLAGAMESEPEFGQPLYPIYQADLDRYMAIARQQLDEATIASLTEEGRSMTMEQAIEFALARDELQ